MQPAIRKESWSHSCGGHRAKSGRLGQMVLIYIRRLCLVYGAYFHYFFKFGVSGSVEGPQESRRRMANHIGDIRPTCAHWPDARHCCSGGGTGGSPIGAPGNPEAA